MATTGDPHTDLGYRGSVAKVEPYGIEHIPDSERHGKPFNQFTTWTAANLTLSLLAVGFFPTVLGLSLRVSLLAALVGAGLGACMIGALATMGQRLGVPQQIQARGGLGFYGNFIPVAFVNVFAAVGWAGVNGVFAVQALQQLVDVPFWLGGTALFLIIGALAVWGYNLLHVVNRIATIILVLLFFAITILAMGKADWSYGANPDAAYYMGTFGGFVTAAGYFFAWFLAWSPFASDFARYLPESTSVRKVFGWTTLGNFVPAAWLGCTGILIANFAGNYGPVEAIEELAGGWGWLAMLTLVFACIPTNALTVYGGALSILTLRIPVPRHIGAAIITAIALVAGIVLHDNIYTLFYDFLLLSAYFIAPFVTVLVLDYWVGGRRDATRIGELFDPRRAVEWGFVAWIGGGLASIPFWMWTRYTGPVAAANPTWGDWSYVAGALVAAVLYLCLSRLPALSTLLGFNQRTADSAPEAEDAVA
ncbi:purine-cytosine permease family protein [Nocardioides zeae]|uniref:Purine-cytosine permease-like protein n=1 Tax=Nocardioides zeae TaxID=1457234 RepID=A0AAJ1U4P9_9ACTN|nr:cytosine permease [Nocardioides zeae]MDQ1105453.1 purine-cytosine permease-like protein [Nocardioides zeae]